MGQSYPQLGPKTGTLFSESILKIFLESLYDDRLLTTSKKLEKTLFAHFLLLLTLKGHFYLSWLVFCFSTFWKGMHSCFM